MINFEMDFLQFSTPYYTSSFCFQSSNDKYFDKANAGFLLLYERTYSTYV